jgi:hypothetical protein
MIKALIDGPIKTMNDNLVAISVDVNNINTSSPRIDDLALIDKKIKELTDIQSKSKAFINKNRDNNKTVQYRDILGKATFAINTLRVKYNEICDYRTKTNKIGKTNNTDNTFENVKMKVYYQILVVTWIIPGTMFETFPIEQKTKFSEIVTYADYTGAGVNYNSMGERMQVRTPTGKYSGTFRLFKVADNDVINVDILPVQLKDTITSEVVLECLNDVDETKMRVLETKINKQNDNCEIKVSKSKQSSVDIDSLHLGDVYIKGCGFEPLYNYQGVYDASSEPKYSFGEYTPSNAHAKDVKYKVVKNGENATTIVTLDGLNRLNPNNLDLFQVFSNGNNTNAQEAGRRTRRRKSRRTERSRRRTNRKTRKSRRRR